MLLGILAYMTFMGRSARSKQADRTLLHVSAALGGRDRAEAMRSLLESIEPDAHEVDLRRIDVQEESFDASLIVDLKDSSTLGGLLDRLNVAFPGSSVSVVEAESID